MTASTDPASPLLRDLPAWDVRAEVEEWTRQVLMPWTQSLLDRESYKQASKNIELRADIKEAIADRDADRILELSFGDSEKLRYALSQAMKRKTVGRRSREEGRLTRDLKRQCLASEMVDRVYEIWSDKLGKQGRSEHLPPSAADIVSNLLSELGQPINSDQIKQYRKLPRNERKKWKARLFGPD